LKRPVHVSKTVRFGRDSGYDLTCPKTCSASAAMPVVGGLGDA
jgi:hypothetical protein